MGVIQQGYTCKDDFVERASGKEGFVICFSVQVRKEEHHFLLGCTGRWVSIASAGSANKRTEKNTAPKPSAIQQGEI